MPESKADTQRNALLGGYGLVFLGGLHTMATLAGGHSYLVSSHRLNW